jgi:hypothetical protein
MEDQITTKPIEETSEEPAEELKQLSQMGKPATKNYTPLLLGVIILLLVFIAVLLVVVLSAKTGNNSVTNTPTPVVTELVPSVTPAATTVPLVTVAPTQAISWKNFSNKVTGIYDTLDVTVTGEYPVDSVTDKKNLDAAGVRFSNSKYSLELEFVMGGEIMHYASYKSLPGHAQFGEIFRVRTDDTGNQASYIKGPITTTGTCAYLGENISAPCGPDMIGGSSSTGGTGFILNIRCTAALEYRNTICDAIVESLRVQ